MVTSVSKSKSKPVNASKLQVQNLRRTSHELPIGFKREPVKDLALLPSFL